MADELGKCFVLVRPGSYYFTVEEKLPDGSYKKVYQSDVMELKSGILPHNIKIKRPPLVEPEKVMEEGEAGE